MNQNYNRESQANVTNPQNTTIACTFPIIKLDSNDIMTLKMTMTLGNTYQIVS